MKKWYIALTIEPDLASTTPDRRPPTDVKYIRHLLFKLIIIPSLKNSFPRKWKLFCWSSPTTTPVKHKKIKNFPHADPLFMGELIVLMDHFYLWSCFAIIITISQMKKSALQIGIFFSKSMHRTGTQIFRQRWSVDTKPSSSTHLQKKTSKKQIDNSNTQNIAWSCRLSDRPHCENVRRGPACLWGLIPGRGKFNEWGRGWPSDIAGFSDYF